MSELINAYTVSPLALKPGDVMCFVIKAMVMYEDQDGTLRYRLYRCPWEGTLDDMPQGSQLRNHQRVCREIFPSLDAVGKPG